MGNQNDTTLGLLAHLLALFSGFIGPLIMFIVTKEQGGKAYENSKHALNFQLSMLIYYVVSGILIFVLIGLILLPILALFNFVLVIIATVKAANGEVYTYPLEIGFIK
jgi:uncharacterized protein